MIIIRDDSSVFSFIEEYLQKKFATKDMGILQHFLGLEIFYSKKGILVSQQKYIAHLIGREAISDYRVCDTSMELNVKLQQTDGVPLFYPIRYW